MALLANKTGDGMLGLRWSKIKLGCGSSAVVKTVQASHVGYDSDRLSLQASTLHTLWLDHDSQCR